MSCKYKKVKKYIRKIEDTADNSVSKTKNTRFKRDKLR